MPVKAVFFDIDNTLYDSATLSKMARRNSVLAMIDSGLDQPMETVLGDLDQIIEKHGSNYRWHYDELLKLYGMCDAKIIASGVVAYEHTKNAYLKPLAGVVPTLIELKKYYLIGAISNGLTLKQWEKLVGLRLHHFFDSVVTSEGCGCEKPASEIFLAALTDLDVKPGDAVMVGDKYDVDIKGAQNVGMHALWLRKEAPKNSNEINRFSDLIKVLKGLE
ncbi:flavin mononucleotide phosphatase YigB [archaeon BMS3Abin16]|nr:flavin mononucleotide phosphatase YigB [archaeon BMS3Abin16]GBE56111.1 flavin mononucleotide phosphatase YigB [archaeon BMS3Bbin16]HDY73665.1 TIGR02253 family HAD-type hydrolase [Euryarchaeota archaeon]